MSNSDVPLARALLTGYFSIDDKGLPHSRYLDADSEREGRRVLANLLRNDAPLERGLRCALAALFDPDSEPMNEDGEDWPYTPNDRKLEFKFRSRKRRTDHVRNTAIVQDVYSSTKSGNSVEEAIATTADKFGLSEDAVNDLWKRYRDFRRANLFKEQGNLNWRQTTVTDD